MYIEFVNGSTWQVIGSDRYNSLVGAGVAGVTFSEWALCNPSAWGYISPMMRENKGWASFITTPRGQNHAHTMLEHAQASPDWFGEISSVLQTGAFNEAELAEIKQEYVTLYGEDFGTAQFEQEYLCSFDAAILGAYYGSELAKARAENRITDVPHDPNLKVHTVWDIGYSDDTCILFVQMLMGEVRIIDTYATNGKDLEHYANVIKGKDYDYAAHWLPHDAQAKTLVAAGRSVIEQLRDDHDIKNLKILQNKNTEQQGILAARQLFSRLWIDEKQDEFLAAISQFRREWDDDKKCFRDKPVHDWTNHFCFTGDTEILTHNGMCRIMDLPERGEVLTLCGWKQYENPRITRKNARLVEVAFTDGLTVRCTPDHSFLTESGWKSAENLKKGTMIQSSLTQSRNIMAGKFIDYSLAKSIYLAAVKRCIGQFGKVHSEKSRKGATYITKMVILKTIYSQILNVLTAKNICHSRHLGGMLKKKYISRTKLERKQQNGIDQKKADCGIVEMLNNRKAGLNGKGLKRIALFARRNSKHLSEKVIAKNSVDLIAGQPICVESVRDLNITDDVWCLTVPDGSHFSLSNGAIVHNCDTLRYLAWVWKDPQIPKEPPKPKTFSMTPEHNTTTFNDLMAEARKRRMDY